MKTTRVLTVGVFDLFHLGHLNLLIEASRRGGHLTVGVHDDRYNTKGVRMVYSLADRVKLVRHLSMVDEVRMYERVDRLVEEVDFDVFVYGPDQNHCYFQRAFEWCRANGRELVCLPRTQGVSSSFIRRIVDPVALSEAFARQ